MKKQVMAKHASVSVAEIDKKLDLLLKEQRRLQKEHKKLARTEEDILHAEHEEVSGLQKLKELEKAIGAAVEPHPLRKLTLRDIAQGTVGAFIGVLAHFTFIYGIKVAEEITVARAALLFPLSLIIGGVFLYATGFRKVPRRYLWYMPIRLLVLFVISVLMAMLVLFIFRPDFAHNIDESFKQVATVSMMGLIGAITADLIGKE